MANEEVGVGAIVLCLQPAVQIIVGPSFACLHRVTSPIPRLRRSSTALELFDMFSTAGFPLGGPHHGLALEIVTAP